MKLILDRQKNEDLMTKTARLTGVISFLTSIDLPVLAVDNYRATPRIVVGQAPALKALNGGLKSRTTRNGITTKLMAASVRGCEVLWYDAA